MATSITTFNGMRCTKVPRTQIFTTISTSAASETAGAPDTLSSITGSVSSVTQSASTSSITALAATVISASSSTITAAATIATANTDPSSSQISSDSASKKDIIAAAVGASMGAVAVVGLVILCAYIRRRKRRISRMDGGEKSGNRDAGTGRFSGPAQPITGLKQRMETTFISPVMTATRAVINRIRDHRSATEIIQHIPGSQGRPEIFEDSMPATRQVPFQNGETPHPVDPFADPPLNANATNLRPENPFLDPIEQSTWADYANDIPTSMPLTVRNTDLDSAGNHNNNNTTATRERDTYQSTLSGSTLNLSNGRASSPVVPDFKYRLENWRRERKPEDRTSAYSDPFDLDRPPTIHSSAYPTPMIEQKYREGYFPEEYNLRQHVS